MSGLGEDDPEAQVIARALREGLQDLGWHEGRNIRTEYRWAVDSPERARAAVDDLLAVRVDLIMPGTTQMTEAVRHAKRPVPAIFVNVSDPVGTGLVESLARPGGNITGFTNFEYGMGEKWLQALAEIAPGVASIAVIANPRNPNTGLYLRAMEDASTRLGLRLVVMQVNNGSEIERAVEEFARDQGGGLLALPDPLTLANRDRILAVAARHRLPGAYPFRLFVERGGLLSYSTDRADLYRRAAAYVDRVLKGERAGDLPVQQPTKFELVINLRTAKALALEVPGPLLARADEVIE
jgi:putative ABC transport system substrate-binding protein